jgi:hypothetical protein
VKRASYDLLRWAFSRTRMRYGLRERGKIWEGFELASDTVTKHDPSFESRGMEILIQVLPGRVVVSFQVWELGAYNLASEQYTRVDCGSLRSRLNRRLREQSIMKVCAAESRTWVHI